MNTYHSSATKTVKRSPVALIIVLILAALFVGACSSSGCERFSNPQGWSSGTVSGDDLYIGTMEGEVLAVEKETGDQRWRKALPTEEDLDRGIYGAPAVTDDVVLVGGYDGVLYAYDRQGDQLWQERFPGRIVGGPTVYGNLALVGTGSVGQSRGSRGALYAIDIQEGDPVWSYNTSGPIWSSPAVVDGVAYVGSLDHHVHAVNVSDGTEKWSYKTGGAVVSGFAVHDGLVMFGGFDSTFYALDADSGNLVWDFHGSTRWFWAAPLVHDGTVYAPSLDGTLYALDVQTGSLEWRYTTEGQLVGTPAVVNDLIAVPVADGGNSKIVLIEFNGAEQGACLIGDDVRTSIEVSGDLIYFASTDHTIRALRIKGTGNPDEEWVYVTDADNPYPHDRAKAC